MFMTSDKHERELIEAAIREAQEMRSAALAQALKTFATWLKREFVVVKSHIKNRKWAPSFTHTGHAT